MRNSTLPSGSDSEQDEPSSSVGRKSKPTTSTSRRRTGPWSSDESGQYERFIYFNMTRGAQKMSVVLLETFS